MKLKEIERAINKTTIVIHSCLCFIVSTTSFTQKINNVYALFTRYSVTILACVTRKMLRKEMLDHLDDVEQYYR